MAFSSFEVAFKRNATEPIIASGDVDWCLAHGGGQIVAFPVAQNMIYSVFERSMPSDLVPRVCSSSREANASKQEIGAPVLIQSEPKGLQCHLLPSRRSGAKAEWSAVSPQSLPLT
jgi:hypothetical protein